MKIHCVSVCLRTSSGPTGFHQQTCWPHAIITLVKTMMMLLTQLTMWMTPTWTHFHMILLIMIALLKTFSFPVTLCMVALATWNVCRHPEHHQHQHQHHHHHHHHHQTERGIGMREHVASNDACSHYEIT